MTFWMQLQKWIRIVYNIIIYLANFMVSNAIEDSHMTYEISQNGI